MYKTMCGDLEGHNTKDGRSYNEERQLQALKNNEGKDFGYRRQRRTTPRKKHRHEPNENEDWSV